MENLLNQQLNNLHFYKKNHSDFKGVLMKYMRLI